MKIAFFIMLHRSPQQFAWLWNAIYNRHDHFLIHIDRKACRANGTGTSDAARFAEIVGDRDNVAFMASRVVNWGGWTLSKLELDAVRTAVRSLPGWSYFMPLSGQCYPARPLSELRSHLSAHAPANFVEMREIAGMDALSWHVRRMPMIEFPSRAFKIPIRRRAPLSPRIDWTGSNWCVLSRKFCDWIAEAGEGHPVCRYLSRTILSDELIMQNLLVHSPYRDERADFLHHLEWPGPKVLEAGDLERIAATGKFFARKFDIAKDETVLHRLAARNGFAVPASVPHAKSA